MCILYWFLCQSQVFVFERRKTMKPDDRLKAKFTTENSHPFGQFCCKFQRPSSGFNFFYHPLQSQRNHTPLIFERFIQPTVTVCFLSSSNRQCLRQIQIQKNRTKTELYLNWPPFKSRLSKQDQKQFLRSPIEILFRVRRESSGLFLPAEIRNCVWEKTAGRDWCGDGGP